MDTNLTKEQIAQIRQIVRSEMDTQTNQGSPMVPPHSHNGTDNLQISEDSLILGTKYATQFDSDGNMDASGYNIFSINSVNNVSRIVFKGFLANNSSGNTPTKRVMITGEAMFGTTFGLEGATPNVTVKQNANRLGLLSFGVVPDNQSSVDFAQFSNYIYIDSTTAAASVGLGPILAHARVGGVVVAYLALTGYSKSTLSFQMYVAPGSYWRFQGELMIT